MAYFQFWEFKKNWGGVKANMEEVKKNKKKLFPKRKAQVSSTSGQTLKEYLMSKKMEQMEMYKFCSVYAEHRLDRTDKYDKQKKKKNFSQGADRKITLFCKITQVSDTHANSEHFKWIPLKPKCSYKTSHLTPRNLLYCLYGGIQREALPFQLIL